MKTKTQNKIGFGLHLVDVTTSLTTGGLNVSEIEAKIDEKMGDMTVFDHFMDYNTVLFAGEDLPKCRFFFENNSSADYFPSF